MAERNRRRTFWPVVLLGVAGSGLAAIAGTHAMSTEHWPAGAMVPPDTVKNDSPATTALALVALAVWGVILVTRGWMRQLLTVLGACAALCTVATIAIPLALGHIIKGGAAAAAPGTTTATYTWTAWPWVALVVSVLAFAAAMAAVFLVRDWPEMGRRYDAPTTGPQLPEDLDEAENIDLWKTISEGHDPTSDQD